MEDKGDGDEILYSFDTLPQEISIYPKNFELKNYVTKYLDKWNSDIDIDISGRTLTLDDRSELTYTDTIGMIINVIDTLITAITIALIAFTSLSLVVSCFMIAVITIISVMERIKEIGVIRSLGGRKKDVSRLFIAENIIIGFFAGVIGIAVTYVICIIINAIVNPLGVSNIANLTILTAILMVALSTFLTTISGLIPSHNASKQDPVVALRTE